MSIAPLIPHLRTALAAIAPEKLNLLVSASAGVTLEVVADPTWVCHFEPGSKTIRFSTRVLEVLWAASYAYFVVYQEIAARKVAGHGGHVVLELLDDPKLKGAADLLQWAFEDFANDSRSSWPVGLPRPVPNPPKESVENVTDELALCAAAFLLHHELAHHRLHHQGGEANVDQERDADHAAVDWILSGLAHSSSLFTKRGLGIVVGVVVMAAYGIHTGKHDGVTHPRSFDRVINALDRREIQGGHLLWAFACAALKLHLDNSSVKVSQPAAGFEDFRAAVDAYVEALAEVDARGTATE